MSRDASTVACVVQVSMLYELMGAKREDDEFVLQIAHSLVSLLECQATRSMLLESTQVVSCFCFLMPIYVHGFDLFEAVGRLFVLGSRQTVCFRQ